MPAETRLNRLYWVAAFMLLLTHAVLAWQSRPAAIEPASNDDAQYVLLARSLRSFHYRDSHIPGAPVHAQYPPVYPALIAAGTAVFGERLGVVQVVTIICSMLTLLLVFDMARRLASPLVAILLLAPLAFNAHLVGYASRIASEMPYMMFSFAALWVLVAFPQTRRPLLWAGLLTILAALTRSIGLSLVVALLALLLLQRRFKPAAIFAVAAALTVGAWLYWTTISPNQFTERSYSAVATTTGRHVAPGALSLLVVRSTRFLKTYVAQNITAGLEFPTFAGSSIDNVAWILLIFGLGGVGLWSVRKRLPLLPLYVLSFMGLLLVYPFKLTRFFMPLAPLVLLAMFLGVIALTRRWKPGVGVAVMVLLSGGILTHSVPRSLALAKKLEHCDRSAALTSPQCWRPETNAFLAATRRANEVLPRDAVVLTIKEAAFNYYTGREVYHPDLAYKKGGKNMLAFLSRMGINYALVSAYVGGAEFSPVLAPACQRIEVLGRYEPRTALLQIHPEGESVPVASNACQLIQDWTRHPDPTSEVDED
jgi:hypothetical protein